MLFSSLTIIIVAVVLYACIGKKIEEKLSEANAYLIILLLAIIAGAIAFYSSVQILENSSLPKHEEATSSKKIYPVVTDSGAKIYIINDRSKKLWYFDKSAEIPPHLRADLTAVVIKDKNCKEPIIEERRKHFDNYWLDLFFNPRSRDRIHITIPPDGEGIVNR